MDDDSMKYREETNTCHYMNIIAKSAKRNSRPWLVSKTWMLPWSAQTAALRKLIGLCPHSAHLSGVAVQVLPAIHPAVLEESDRRDSVSRRRNSWSVISNPWSVISPELYLRITDHGLRITEHELAVSADIWYNYTRSWVRASHKRTWLNHKD